MKPIELQTQTDGNVSLQIVRPYITDNKGKKPCKKEICLLIETDEDKDIIVNFNYQQAKSLLKSLQELVGVLELEQVSSN